MKAATDLGIVQSPTPTQLNRFRVIDTLAQGGMANVLLAVIPGPARFHKLVVVKTIRSDIGARGNEFGQMFLDEARLSARLNHQNVVQTYEVGEHEGTYFIAMEYLEGQTLRHVQRRLTLSKLPLEARLRILIDTAHGLHHAHELADYAGNPLHVVHRDVSPQNIFLTYDGQVKLLDFGIAKTRDADAVTSVGQIKGKIDYMAPEQLAGEAMDRRADVFSLGALMWEMLADRPLSGGDKISQAARVTARIANREPRIRTVIPDVDAELSRICDKALAHNPEDRYTTAFDFAYELQCYLAERSLVPSAQQMALILQPAFNVERANMRDRLQRALAAVEDGSLERDVSQSGAFARNLHLPITIPTRSGYAAVGHAHGAAPRKDRLVIAARALLVASVVGAAAWLGLSDDASTRPATESHAVRAAQAPEPRLEQPTGAEATLAARADTIRLRIDARTQGARVMLDGAELPQLPFEAEVRRDNEIHQLSMIAPGHETLTRALVFDRDVTLELELEPTPADTHRSRRRSRESAESDTTKSHGEEMVAVPDVSKQDAPTEPQRIDDENPYL
jgi:serine/threonine-protein kinase